MNEKRRLKKMRYGHCPTGCEWIFDYELTKHNYLVKTKNKFGVWEYLPLINYKSIKNENPIL